MPLHPQIAAVLADLPHPPDDAPPDHAAPDPAAPDPAGLRADEEAQVPPAAERRPLHAVEDTIASTPTGEVPVRVYTPVEADAYGLLVYLHGGAFFLGSLDTHDHVARDLAGATGLKVVSVDYRRVPEAAYPAGLQDCYGVIRWAADDGAHGSLGWDGRTLAVAGDSSGGNFVAAVTAMAHDDRFDRITHQVLFYPSLDLDFDVDRYASLRENAEGYGLETAGLKPFNAFYVDSGADPADPLVSPIKREDLTGLPPALILTGQYDPLRDEGELYGKRLAEAGVDTTVSRYPGAGHGFVQYFSWIPEYHRAFEETAEFLEEELSTMAHHVDIHPLFSPWGRFGLYSFFIDAPEPAIVDTGIGSSPAEGMAPALERLGRRIEDVRWILLTHGHIDHLGGAHALWELTGRRAQVVIHEADAGLLRSRRAHVDLYAAVRAQYLHEPDGVEKQTSMAAAAISGEMEPSVIVTGGETLSLGGDVSVSVHHIPGHTAGSVAYVVDGQDDVFVGDAAQIHGAANGFPGYEDPDAYRSSLLHLRDDIRPQHLYLGHPYRTADGEPYGVELDAEAARRAIQESLDIEARVGAAARRAAADGPRETESVYSPFAQVAEELGYSGDPRLEPSPFFTTLHGYVTHASTKEPQSHG